MENRGRGKWHIMWRKKRANHNPSKTHGNKVATTNPPISDPMLLADRDNSFVYNKSRQ